MIVTEASTIDLPAWRHARSLSQTALAALLALPAKTLMNWEQGRNPPPHVELVRLALVGLDAENGLGPTVEAIESFDAIQEHAPAAPQPSAIDASIEAIVRAIRAGR